MDSHTKNTYLNFPCTFPLKVMGYNSPEFPAVVLSIFHKHIGQENLSLSQRTSRGDKYVSITVTFVAQSKSQLDALYRELNSNKQVLMTL